MFIVMRMNMFINIVVDCLEPVSEYSKVGGSHCKSKTIESVPFTLLGSAYMPTTNNSDFTLFPCKQHLLLF